LAAKGNGETSHKRSFAQRTFSTRLYGLNILTDGSDRGRSGSGTTGRIFQNFITMSELKFLASCILDFFIAVFVTLFCKVKVPEMDKDTEAFYHE
jgi:hypothetical protein